VQCKVALTDGPLEFLVCRAGTKDYESVLSTAAVPSSLHGLLLAMGLAPGKPARTLYPDGDQPLVLPPRGPKLTLTVRWTDEKNVVHEMPAQELLSTRQADPNDKNPPQMPDHWVFVGSYVAPNGMYLADREGEMISVSNFGASVIDVPFESSDKNDRLSYRANTEKIPAKGTAVELVIQVTPGAENEPHARALVEVDRFGRFLVENKPLTEDELTAWASRFARAHTRAEVLLRLDERALVGDIMRVQDALKFGGIWDTHQEIAITGNEPLPRTAQQAKDSLAVWAQRFAAGQRLVADPVRDANRVLENLRQQSEDAQTLLEIWKTYAEEITKGVESYSLPGPR
jgi:biopolymer transport protein ExbD